MELEIKQRIPCYLGARSLKYIKERNEVVIGHSGGVVSVISLDPRLSCVVCRLWIADPDSSKLHNDDITSLAYHPETKRVYTASKDKLMRIWDFPEGAWAEDYLVGSTTWGSSSNGQQKRSRSKSPSQQIIEARLGGDYFDPQGNGT